MIRMMSSPDDKKVLERQMRKRALECFSIYHLDELFILLYSKVK